MNTLRLHVALFILFLWVEVCEKDERNVRNRVGWFNAAIITVAGGERAFCSAHMKRLILRPHLFILSARRSARC